MAEVKFPTTSYLRKLLNAVHAVSETVSFDFLDKSLLIASEDPSGYPMCTMNLPASAFLHYSSQRNSRNRFTVDLERIKQALGLAAKREICFLKYSNGRHCQLVFIEIYKGASHDVTVPILNRNIIDKGASGYNYPVRVQTDARRFQNQCTELMKFGYRVGISARKSGFVTLAGKRYTNEENQSVQVAADFDITVYFAYIGDFSAALSRSLALEVTMYVSQEKRHHAIIVEYILEGGACIRAYGQKLGD